MYAFAALGVAVLCRYLIRYLRNRDPQITVEEGAEYDIREEKPEE